MYAGCLLACTHLSAFQAHLGKDMPFYEAALLAKARANLEEDQSAATGHEMIAIVTALSCAQLAAGYPGSSAHLQGLKRIVDLRGGLTQINKEEPVSCLTDFTILHDLIHAISRNVAPIFMNVIEPSFSTPELKVEDVERYWDSPLSVSDHPTGLSEMEFLPKDLRETLKDLTNLLELRYMQLCGNKTAHTAIVHNFSIIQHRLQKLSSVASAMNERSNDDIQWQYARACFLGASIFCRAVGELVPFESAVNTAEQLELESILRRRRLEDWRFFPFIYYWL
jgi:hypothetical protein